MRDTKEISLELYYGDMPSVAGSANLEKREPSYPTFHYEGKEELDLPDEGEMTITFRKTSSTSSVDKKGEHRYACTIEVQSICDVEDGDEDDIEAPAHGSDKSVSDLLDDMMKKHVEAKAKEGY
jgi:hypothetical protein